MSNNNSTNTSGSTDRFFNFLWLSFVVAICIIGWGRTAYYSGNKIVFSFGGNSSGIIFPLFFIYCSYRLYKKDFSHEKFWNDPLFIFSIYVFISPIWSSLRDFSWVKGYILPAFMGYCMGSYLLERDFRRFRFSYIILLFFFATLIVLRGLFELIFIPGSVNIMHSTVEHHTMIALVIILAIPLVVGVLFERGSYPILSSCCLIVLILGIFFVSSRIGWISFIFLCFFFFWKIKHLRKRILLFIVPVLVFSIMFILLPHYRERFFSLGHLVSDRETGTRIENWRMCTNLIKKHFIFGLGYSNKEYIRATRQYDSHFQYEHPHNLYLQIICYTGLLGLILLGFLFWKVYDAFRKYRGMAESPLYIALQATFLAFLLFNLVDSALNSHRASLMTFLLLAYLFKFSKNENK